MSKFNTLAIAAFAVFVMMMVQITSTNGTTLMNPAFGSHGYITRAVADLLDLTRNFLNGTLRLDTVKLAPEPAIFAMIGIALIGFGLLTRKPKRG